MAEPVSEGLSWEAFMGKLKTKDAPSDLSKVISPARATSYTIDKSTGAYTPKWNAPVNAGGVGTYAYIPDSDGNLIGMDKAAAGTYTSAGGTGLISGEPTAGTDWLGLANIGLKGMSVFTDIGELGLAKDTLAFNKMNANRAYDADKLKYNNALARTEAVNSVYGSPNVATKLT